MTQDFVFIGDTGKQGAAMLEILHKGGLSPRRLSVSDELKSTLGKDPPVTIMFGPDVEDLGKIVTSIREDQTFAEVPLLARVPSLDFEVIESVFRNGIDDYMLDGKAKQFEALVAVVQKEESWRAVRAPAGRVILADAVRTERVRLGSVLRRNGFDTYFAGSSEDLEKVLANTSEYRAVIVSSELFGKPVIDIAQTYLEMQNSLPWVIVAPSDKMEEFAALFPNKPGIKFFEAGADAEGLTFIMNEMLAPPPVGARRSDRVLYGAPVSFAHKKNEEPFYGYVYNINLGGIYIRSLSPMPLQTRIEIAFRPPFGRGQVVANAQVVWCKKLGDTKGAASPPGMGVQFLDMWPADQAAYETGYQNLVEDENERQTQAPRDLTVT